jgi:hypothetical protein
MRKYEAQTCPDIHTHTNAYFLGMKLPSGSDLYAAINVDCGVECNLGWNIIFADQNSPFILLGPMYLALAILAP